VMGHAILRRVHGERVLLAGGQRSLVMQLAHPLVAAAVAEHSDFPRKAERAAAHIRSVHRRVTGTAEAGGRATPYRAQDPSLLLWVHATVVDTTMLVYRRFVGPLAPGHQRTYYEAMKEPARLLGVPDRVIPPDLPSFRRYMRAMVGGSALQATEASRPLVASVLRPPVGLVLRPITEGTRLVTLALLPERIRALFGLDVGPAARMTLATTSGVSRAILPLLPAVIRTFPQAREETPAQSNAGELR
jgi:uncharacterized protein (DUF2236 family)